MGIACRTIHFHLSKVCFALLLLLPTGCATYGDESIKDRPADWPPLTMTRDQLIGALGQPRLRTVAVENGQTKETYIWSYTEAEAHPALFVPVVGLFVAASGNGISGESRALTAVFSPDGKMISRAWSQGRIGNREIYPQSTPQAPDPNRYDPTTAGSQ